jgi:hypothetical protein
VNDLFTSQIKHITWESRLTDYMKVLTGNTAVHASCQHSPSTQSKRLPVGLQQQIQENVYAARAVCQLLRVADHHALGVFAASTCVSPP